MGRGAGCQGGSEQSTEVPSSRQGNNKEQGWIAARVWWLALEYPKDGGGTHLQTHIHTHGVGQINPLLFQQHFGGADDGTGQHKYSKRRMITKQDICHLQKSPRVTQIKEGGYIRAA